MDDSAQLMEGSVRVRRPSLKKRLAEASDEDEAPRRSRKAKPRKRARTESAEATPSPQDEEIDVGGEVDMDVSVDIEGDASTSNLTSPEPTPPPQPPRLSRKSSAKVEPTAPSAAKRMTKKRQVIFSDEEEEETTLVGPNSQPKPHTNSDNDADDFEPPAHTLALLKSKSAAATTKNGKGLPSMRGPKRKQTKDDKPIMMKDESKPRPSTSSLHSEDRTTVDAAGPSVRTAISITKPEVDTTESAVVQSPEDAKPTPAIPVKRKLPTIKKIKPAGLVPSTGTSTPTATRPPNPVVPPKPAAGPAIGQRKPALTVGNKDVDLFNSGVYAELFGKGGSSTPRSGVNRREKDERRKELDRMRDEARAAREAEARKSFDLQAQAEKVARFEERMRNSRTRAFLPNFIAGALQDRYEREQRALDGH